MTWIMVRATPATTNHPKPVLLGPSQDPEGPVKPRALPGQGKAGQNELALTYPARARMDQTRSARARMKQLRPAKDKVRSFQSRPRLSRAVGSGQSKDFAKAGPAAPDRTMVSKDQPELRPASPDISRPDLSLSNGSGPDCAIQGLGPPARA